MTAVGMLQQEATCGRRRAGILLGGERLSQAFPGPGIQGASQGEAVGASGHGVCAPPGPVHLHMAFIELCM